MLKSAHLLLYFLVNTLEYRYLNETILVSKIIGGVDTDIDYFPSFVQLVRELHKPTIICAGTYIHKIWVLTAAHCTVQGIRMVKILDDDLSLRMGMSKLTDAYQERQSVKIMRHPKFSLKDRTTGPRYDIALVQIDRKFEFNIRVGLARIFYKRPALLNVVVVGFGSTTGVKEDAPYIRLQKVHLMVTRSLADMLECHDTGSKGACFGDSGGPMFSVSDRTLVGIVSRGNCRGQGLYVNVFRYRYWIEDTANIFIRNCIFKGRLSVLNYFLIVLNVLDIYVINI